MVLKKNTLSFENIVYFLASSFPFAFLLGPFFLELFSFFISIYFLVSLIKERQLNLKKYNLIIKIIFIFWVYLFLSSFFSDYWSYTISKSFFYIRFLIFSLAFAFILSKNEKIILYFFYSLLIVFLLLIFGAFYEIIFKNICGYFTESGSYIFNNNLYFCSKKFLIGNVIRLDRLSSFFGTEMILGSFLSRLLPLLSFLYFYIYRDNKSKNIFFFFLILLSSYVIYLSGERLSFFYNIVFLLIILIFYKKFYLAKLTLSLFFIFIIFLTFSFYKVSSKRMFEQTLTQITNSNTNKNQLSLFSSTEHRDHAVAAFRIFLDNKFIGSGINTFRYICPASYQKTPFSCSTHPHNTYLQLLSEVGILGFLIPFGLFMYVFFFYIKNFIVLCFYKNASKNSFVEFSIMACFLITLFPLVPSGNFFTNFLSYIYYLPFGFFLYYRKFI